MAGRRAPAVLLCALALSLGAAACGEESADDGAAGVGEERAGSVARLAQCRDWNEGSVPEKLATIADLRKEGPGGEADARLPDEEAIEVIDRACAPSYADGFRLYKVYYRAIAFQPLLEGQAEGAE